MSPYVTPPVEIAQTRRRRFLIVGKSGTRKTTSLLTAPRPIAILNYPGELGWDSVPDNDQEIYKRVWADDVGKPLNPDKVVKEVEQEALSLIASGKYKSIFFEGLHHYATAEMDVVTDGAFVRGEDFEPKLYALGYRRILDHIARMSNTNVPVMGWTCWAEQKMERTRRPGEKNEDVPKKIYCALPGQLAHNLINGRFSVMLYQALRVRKDKTGAVIKNDRNEPVYDAWWQTRPQGEVMCAGLKGDRPVVERIPTYIPANYQALEDAWVKAEKEAATHG